MLKSTLVEAVQAGAAEISRYINTTFAISNKEGINNLVTEADHAAEKAILGVIKSSFPDHHILSEEAGEMIMDSNYKWIIDPIDGTVNFAHGIPLCCVSIAIEHDMPNGPLDVFERFIRKGIPVRRLGSAAIDLCWVACGRFDGFYEHKLEAWDSAAGFLLVVEAGGRVTDFKGNKFSPYQPHVLATNGLIHDEMLSWINPEL